VANSRIIANFCCLYGLQQNRTLSIVTYNRSNGWAKYPPGLKVSKKTRLVREQRPEAKGTREKPRRKCSKADHETPSQKDLRSKTNRRSPPKVGRATARGLWAQPVVQAGAPWRPGQDMAGLSKGDLQKEIPRPKLYPYYVQPILPNLPISIRVDAH
jgi:hypothetical protein